MSAVLARLRAAFILEEERPTVAAPAHTALAAHTVLITPESDALALAAALAVDQAPCGLVCLWGTTPTGWRAPATTTARRATARLTARGLDATASGRCVRVALPTDEAEARAAAQRAAAAFDGPTVLALAAPRGTAWDAILAEADRVVVAGDPDTPLVQAATAALEATGVQADTVEPVSSPLRRALAAAGLSRLPTPRSR